MTITKLSNSTRALRRVRRSLFRSDRPRRIDRYIDFFGQARGARSPALALRLRYHAEEYSEAS